MHCSLESTSAFQLVSISAKGFLLGGGKSGLVVRHHSSFFGLWGQTRGCKNCRAAPHSGCKMGGLHVKTLGQFVAVILVLAGGLFALQGAGIVPGSVMTGQTEWL